MPKSENPTQRELGGVSITTKKDLEMTKTNSSSSAQLLHLPASYETTVFVNEDGNLSITQQWDCDSEADVVSLTRQQAFQVAQSLLDWAKAV